MEKASYYNQRTKEELTQIIVDLKQTIGELKKDLEALMSLGPQRYYK